MATAIQVALAALAAFTFSSPALGAAAREIGSVEVTGVTAFTGEEIQGVIDVQPGDDLDLARVQRTAESLEVFFRIRGYEKAKVEVHWRERTLEFRVREGEPTRVYEIQFVPEGLEGAAFEKYWRHLRNTLAPKLGLGPGDLYDQDHISTGRRSLQEALAVEEFVGARVSDVRVTTAPSAPVLDEKTLAKIGAHPARRWVILELHIDLGDRVSFGFQGNTAFTTNQLDTMIEEQRVLGFGKDYLGAIRARILEEYRAIGYAHASIATYTFERRGAEADRAGPSRHVTFAITEGPRVEIESIAFDGNFVFTPKELKKHFLERAPVLIQTGYYVEKDVQSAADLLIEWMKSKGYLAAKLVTIDPLFPPQAKPRPPGSRVGLTIYLFEGEQTLVREISLQGMHALDPELVKQTISAREGEPLNLFAFSEGLEKLKAAYRAQGYLGVKIVNEGTDQVIRYSQENRAADISIVIAEGPRFRTSKILIEGLTQTHETVVRRQLVMKEGEVLRETDLIQTERNLRKLGLFSVSTIQPTDDLDKPGYKIVHISLQEGTPGIVAGGLGFRNDLGVRVFGQAGYDNLWGENHAVEFTVNANRRLQHYHFSEYQAEASYVWPWFVLDELTFRPVLSTSATQYINFDADAQTVALNFERKILSKPNITALFTYGLEYIHQFNSVNELDNQALLIGSITPGLRLDTRDNPLAPTTGWLASATHEIASPSLLSRAYIPNLGLDPIGYTRSQGRVDRYFTLFDDITWYLSARVGFERSTVAPIGAPGGALDPRTGAIPLIKQFTLGGEGSLRGFNEQELNYQSRTIQGTLSYVNYRTQIDMPFTGSLRFGPFLDAGNLQIDTFSFGSLRYGSGVGFHYQTPVGPVNVEWGFKLDPRPGEDPSHFYFSIGII